MIVFSVLGWWSFQVEAVTKTVLVCGSVIGVLIRLKGHTVDAAEAFPPLQGRSRNQISLTRLLWAGLV